MNDDREFSRRIGRSLDRQEIDSATRNALRDARRQALDSDPAPTRFGWAPAGAAVALALVVALLVQWPVETPPGLPNLAADELAVIAAEADLELLEEWEFYAWFDAQADSSG